MSMKAWAKTSMVLSNNVFRGECLLKDFFFFERKRLFFYQVLLAKYLISYIQKVIRKLCCEIFSCQAGGCSMIRDVDLCLSLLFAHTFVCRDHLMLWPHKWNIFPGCKHLAGGVFPNCILSRNTVVFTCTLMKPHSPNCKYLHGGMNESQPFSLKM